ncbi:hypothetical protein GRF29_77g616637 [Pseudopithomyces chartarum]|uniref:Uncharacterized protein n=1 Tax=Pseudopithomyces chartarum TaxID=1892770 RepID=A0AAN6LW77_9PLEO|nr:hypothetical protein GRF29_77g616637 [Pseudopithomyces chartarum]
MTTPRLLVPLVLLSPALAGHHFGTINLLGQNSEHERITRAALACNGPWSPSGSCFESLSLDQLAGKDGTFGAVGAPDVPLPFGAEAHCDDADFLAHLLNPSGDVLQGFGIALHGVQDFYSHSNWGDTISPPYSIANPPGLAQTSIADFLSLSRTTPLSIPYNLTTGCYAAGVEELYGAPAPESSVCHDRVLHVSVNKDKGLIDRRTGFTSNPGTSRGKKADNFQKAVRLAIDDTRRQWGDFRDELKKIIIKTMNTSANANANAKHTYSHPSQIPPLKIFYTTIPSHPNPPSRNLPPRYPLPRRNPHLTVQHPHQHLIRPLPHPLRIMRQRHMRPKLPLQHPNLGNRLLGGVYIRM